MTEHVAHFRPRVEFELDAFPAGFDWMKLGDIINKAIGIWRADTAEIKVEETIQLIEMVAEATETDVDDEVAAVIRNTLQGPLLDLVVYLVDRFFVTDPPTAEDAERLHALVVSYNTQYTAAGFDQLALPWRSIMRIIPLIARIIMDIRAGNINLDQILELVREIVDIISESRK